MLKEKLIGIGFSENEALLYLLLLRVGPSPVSSLAARGGMKRSTAYAALNSLHSKSLVTYEEVESVRKYIPLDPQVILYDLEEQNVHLKTRIGLAKECISMLDKMENGFQLDRRVLLGFSGEEAVLKAFKSHLKEGSPIHAQVSFLEDKFLHLFKELQVVEEAKHLATKGSLFFQENKLFYLGKHENQLQLLILEDPFCVAYLRQLLFQNKPI